MEYDINKIIEGDKVEFNKFVLHNYKKFYRFVYYFLGNKEDAEDILQDALINIFFKAKKFKFKSSFLTWCYKIIRNKCIDFKREKDIIKMAESITHLFYLKDSSDNEPDKIYERKKIKEEIDKALNKLSLKEKEVFILKHYNHLKIKEISKLTGYSENNIKIILFRCINKLRKYLKNL